MQRHEPIVWLTLCILCAARGSPLVTQTVYGFLDFTTTMGNTVMVFSPNSAPPPEPPTTEKTIQENIIETKPPPPFVTSEKPESIKPSKVSNKENTNSANVPVAISSAITVISLPPKKEEKNINVPKSIVKEEKQIITKVEVVAGPSKIIESSSPKKQPQSVNKPNAANNKKPNIQSASNVASNVISSVTNVISSKVDVKQDIKPSVINKIDKVSISKPNILKEEPAILVTNNNIGEPEYDFLSRQPSEFIEETYKVINIRPSKSHNIKPKHKNRQLSPTPEDEDHPLGLVTTLGGTVIKDGATTIHETSVIGTYISGKYAQVLNSNSKVIQSPGSRAKISPSSPGKILKTAAPGFSKNHRHAVEITPSINDENNGFSKTTKRPSSNASRKHRLRSQENNDNDITSTSTSSPNKKYKNKHSSHSAKSLSEPAGAAGSGRRKGSRGAASGSTSSAADASSRRSGFKPRATPASTPGTTPAPSSSIYRFKLTRAPGAARWQYPSSPKPRVAIRKAGDGESGSAATPAAADAADDAASAPRPDADLELSGSQDDGALYDNETGDDSLEKPPPVETLKVEISTPADFKDVYYEIATLKSPYTFQVGRVKNTRIITVTSTIEKRLEPSLAPTEPLTENILATATPYDKDHNLLESSIATLPIITLSSGMETPPLETVTETFSTTQNMLKTHILPIVKDGNTTSTLTLTQTYQVTRFVTATKTLPPMEYFQFIPSRNLKDFNTHLDEAGSELHLELDFGDSNEEDEGGPRRAYLPDLDLASVGSDFDLTDVDRNKGSENHLRSKKAHGQSKSNQVTEAAPAVAPALTPEQAQQLALLRLLNPAAAAQIPSVITTSKPVLKYETIYESHVIPFFDGKSTVQSTISRIVATVTKTEYELGTSSLPALPAANPLFPQQFTVTSTPVVVNTQVVETDSQVLKLTFGAKTVYTTLLSTRLVPTAVTSYLTSSVPVQPTPAFPGFFPGPYAPFPYVG